MREISRNIILPHQNSVVYEAFIAGKFGAVYLPDEATSVVGLFTVFLIAALIDNLGRYRIFP
jgi:hypothetical protein